MLDAIHGLLFTIAQEYGLIGSRFIIIVHSVIGMAARHPHTSQSPRVSKGSLHWMDKLFVVSSIPQIHERLATAWSTLFTHIACLKGLLVHDCRLIEKRNCGIKDTMRKNEKK